jgi:hypothetical protein
MKCNEDIFLLLFNKVKLYNVNYIKKLKFNYSCDSCFILIKEMRIIYVGL